MSDKFYLTTPIYYPSNKLHIGNAYCTVAADTLVRFQKLIGKDAYLLTGTDEHGQKIERRAQEAGVTPQAFVDEIVAGIRDLWKLMDIEYDDFIRTTEERHAKSVQKIFTALYEKGDIYKGKYEGWYCTPCESFWTDHQLHDGKCPDCGRAVEQASEESYFFRLSKYAPWLIDYINEHPDFIQPPSRAKEMMQNFLLPGLEDLSVTRTSFRWGIPVPFDDKHVIYVWIDALSNYITALGYGSEDDSLYRKFWPADMHLVGKEIVRFHTIIWPIMLKALDLPLPKQVFGHGWLTFDGDKMSKSKGNVVDPVILCERYGSDAIRYFLMRDVPFGSDGNFSNELLLTRMNSDLANDMGNLVSRTVAMIEKYFGGSVPEPVRFEEIDDALIAQANALASSVLEQMNAMAPQNALAEIWKLVGACNRYIDQTQPWVLGKAEAGTGENDRLKAVLYVLAECARIVAVLVGPTMPRTPARIFAQLGVEDAVLKTWESVQTFGALLPGTRVCKGDALFPRIDIPKELEFLQGLYAANAPIKEAIIVEEKNQPQEEGAGLIEIYDFSKVSLKVARVLQAEKVKKSDKLLKIQLSVGNEERTVVSGIAQHYAPEDLAGKHVILVANLKPAKLRGIVSEGMLLAAEDEHGVLRLVTVDGDIADGAEIH